MAEKITISAPFSQESRSLGRIGRVGENLSRQIVFDCTSALTDRPNATIVCVIQRTGDKEPYAAQMTRVGDTGSYKLVLTSTEVAKSGSVRFELRMVDGEEILKAAIYTGTVEASMSGIGDTPGEPIPDALNRLETAISEVGKYADLKEAVETLQTSGTSTAEAADTNAVSIHGADGVYDLSKGTIQARLNNLEDGNPLNVTKKRVPYSKIVGSSSSISVPDMTINANSIVLYTSQTITITPSPGESFNALCYCVVDVGDPSTPAHFSFAVSHIESEYLEGYLVLTNATNISLNFRNHNLQVYVMQPDSINVVTDVSGNVILGGAGDVTKSYVDSQDAALDAKSRQPSMPRMLTAFQFTAQALRMTIQKGRLPHDWKRWRRAAARPARKSRTGQVWHKWDPVKSWLLTTAQPGSLPRRLSWRAIARLAKATRTPPALSRS